MTCDCPRTGESSVPVTIIIIVRQRDQGNYRL